MATSITTFRAAVKEIMMTKTSPNVTTDAMIDRMVRLGFAEYEQHFPYTYSEDITGDGGNYYVLSTSLTYWIDRRSQVVSIQYPAPAIASDEVPVYLKDDDYIKEYRDGSNVTYLYLPNHAPAATEAIRVVYETDHPWVATAETMVISQPAHGLLEDDYIYLDGDDYKKSNYEESNLATHIVASVADADTLTAAVLGVDVPTAHYYPICLLIAANVCDALSAKYSQTMDSTIAIDAVTTTSRAYHFRQQSAIFRKNFRILIGLPEKDTILPAGRFMDLDTKTPRGTDYLFHNSRIQ